MSPSRFRGSKSTPQSSLKRGKHMLEKKASSQGQKGRVFLVRRRSWNVFWQIGVFRLLIAVGICFFLLTGIAMLLYPGGTMTDPHRHGYAFFSNFLSDLGRTSTPSGQDNLASRLLFTRCHNEFCVTICSGKALKPVQT